MSQSNQSTTESPALWFALGAAVALTPTLIHSLSSYIMGPSKCPFTSQTTSQSSLPPTANGAGCPYLASQDQPSPPIDMTKFYHTNHNKSTTTTLSTTLPTTELGRTSSSSSSTSSTSLTGSLQPNTTIKPKKGKDPVHYHTYLDLDNILSAQKPISWQEGGTNAHDEHLFIITHQASELWFKQLLHDLLSIITIMRASYISENSMAVVLERLTRICKIQSLLIEHLHVLQTMTPLSFLDFRDYLYPASGFQSMQFRQVESLLGLERSQRLTYAGSDYDSVLLPEQQVQMREIEETIPTLFSLIDQWLRRTPLLSYDTYNFWSEYQKSVYQMLDEQEEMFKQQYLVENAITKQRYDAEIVNINAQREFFNTFFNEEKYYAAILGQNNTYGKKAINPNTNNGTTLSYKAVQAATMINVYQHLTLFAPAFQLLLLVQEIDSNFAKWRNAHATMVLRMIGGKMGTGGSSGYGYLTETIHKHRIFKQLSDLSSLVIPRPYLPALPDHIIRSSTFFPEDFISPTTSTSTTAITTTTSSTTSIEIDVEQLQSDNNTSVAHVEGNVVHVDDNNSNDINGNDNNDNVIGVSTASGMVVVDHKE